MVKIAGGNKRRDGERPTFKYSHHNPDAVRRRAERSTRSFDSFLRDGVDTWKPKEGDNAVRILPPRWDKAEHYGLQIFVHNNIGPDNSSYLCQRKMNNKRCPMCDAYATARDSGDEEDAKQLRFSERYLYYILDREDTKSVHPVVWSVSNTQDREIGAQAVQRKTSVVLFIDGEDDGYDLSFKRSGQGLATRYTGYQFDRDPSPICESEKTQQRVLDFITENPLPDLLRFYPLDYLTKLVSGESATKDEDEDEQPRRKAKVADDEDITDEDEEEEKPRAKKSKPKDDEDEDEDEAGNEGNGADDDDEDEDELEIKPPPRKPKPGREPLRAKKRSDDDEDETPRRRFRG
jgi:hypothetical protein